MSGPLPSAMTSMVTLSRCTVYDVRTAAGAPVAGGLSVWPADPQAAISPKEKNPASERIRVRAVITGHSKAPSPGYLLVATGRAEAMVDPLMNVWDAGAIQPILEEAGGTFTDWTGQPTIHSQEGIGTNGKVLEEILAITRRAPKRS